MKRLVIYNALLAVIFFLQWFVRNYTGLEAGQHFRTATFLFLFLGSYVISASSLWVQRHGAALYLAVPWALGWSVGAIVFSLMVLQLIFPAVL
jgi:hypothetical protein